MSSDALVTVFSATGVNAMTQAFNTVAAGEAKLGTGMTVYNAATTRATAVTNDLGLELVKNVKLINFDFGILALSTIYGITRGITGLIHSYEELGNTIMSVSAMTGSSMKEAASAVTLMKGAGLSDMQELRDMMRMGKDAFNPQAMSAMARLGVNSSPNQSGLTMFKNILEALDRTSDGIMKTRNEEEIFGARGAAALQPLLRMTKENRDAFLALGDSIDTSGLETLKEFEAKTGILDLSLQIKVLTPIARDFMTLLTPLAEGLTMVIDLWEKLDRFTGGAASWAAVGIAIGAVAIAFGVLTSALRESIIVAAIFDALTGQWQNLALAGVIGIGAGFAIDHILKRDDPKQDSAADKMDRAADKMNQAAGVFVDTFSQFSGRNLPRGLSELDINALAQKHALGITG